MYAIVKTGGKQYTVKAGDVLDVEKLEGAEGDKVDLQVLLVRDGKKTISDPADLAAVKVVAQIVEQHKGDKVLVFKFKKRKGYKRTRGHRQQLTKICIVDLNGEKAAAPKKREERPVAAKADKKAPVKKEAAPKEDKKAATAKGDKEPLAAKDAKAEKKDAPAAKAEAKPAAADKKDAADDLSKKTVAELRDIAKERGVKLESGARKADIIEAIEKA